MYTLRSIIIMDSFYIITNTFFKDYSFFRRLNGVCLFQGEDEGLTEAVVKDKLRQVLSSARPSVTLSGHPAESAYIKVLLYIYVCMCVCV